jgi:thiol-disulfide isomerase/thioredoxin/nitrate reductase assembly molybdenum cofactor insertion protein NarJ
MRLIALLAVAAGAVSAAPRTWPCEAGATALQVQQRYRNPPKGTAEEKREFRRKLLDDALGEQPDDLFVHRQYQRFVKTLGDAEIAAAAEKYRKLVDEHPDDSLYLYLYGLMLDGRNTDEAVKLLNRALEKDTSNPWPHLALSEIYQYGRLVDKQKSTEQVTRFWEICPGSLDSTALEAAIERSSPETAGKIAAGVRARLTKVDDPRLLERYSELWDLELKATPPSRLKDARAAVAADLAKLRAATPPERVSWYQLLKNGAKGAGDASGVTAAEDEILKRFPDNSASLNILNTRFRESHPYKSDSSPAQKQERAAASLAFADEMLKKWPDDMGQKIMQFDAILAQDDAPAARVRQVVEAFLEHMWTNRDVSGYPPIEYRAAETYVKRGIGLERVPEFVQKGLGSIEWRVAEDAKDDSTDPKRLENDRKSVERYRVDGLRILVDLYTKTGEPGKAAAALEEVRQHPPKDGFDSAFYRQAARVAELNGHKLDALVYLETAVDRWKDQAKDKADALADIERLWKELGGTLETRQLWAGRKPGVVEVTSETEWGKPEGALTAFELEDTAGKLWRLKSLEGKTVAINVWATWCGFCVAEHPAFQKLYDKLKDRPDVVLLTFNVDESVAEIEPYMKKNGYTFPVIPAQSLVNTVLPEVGIPRNWIFDVKGVFRWEQIGYNSSDADWEKKFLDVLEKAK